MKDSLVKLKAIQSLHLFLSLCVCISAVRAVPPAINGSINKQCLYFLCLEFGCFLNSVSVPIKSICKVIVMLEPKLKWIQTNRAEKVLVCGYFKALGNVDVIKLTIRYWTNKMFNYDTVWDTSLQADHVGNVGSIQVNKLYILLMEIILNIPLLFSCSLIIPAVTYFKILKQFLAD